jgi:hypothetical protein
MHFDAVEGSPALKDNRKGATAQARLAKPAKIDPLLPKARKSRSEARLCKGALKGIFEIGEAGLSDHAQATTKAQRQVRRFPRYRFDVRIQVSVFREGLTARYWGRTGELGLDGIGATLSGELQVGEVVSLEFPIPLPPRLMKVRAVVRYSEGLRCGFEFLVVTDERKLVLRQVCGMLANAS